MKLLNKRTFLMIMFFASVKVFSQNYQSIPEFVFNKAKLISGAPNQDGSVYRFYNIAPGYDATITIVGRSSSAVVLDTIDISAAGNMGYDKALQPQCGYRGLVPANSGWWMKFRINFYMAGSVRPANIDKFEASALDIDGDGVSVAENITMFKATSLKLNSPTLLKQLAAPSVSCSLDGKTSASKACLGCSGQGYFINNSGKQQKCSTCNGTGLLFSACSHPWTGSDLQVQGPVTNSPDIDTSATKFVASFLYNNVTSFTFQYGAMSGTTRTNSGERYNSMRIKGFSLAEAAPIILPVKLTSFTTQLDKKNVILNWTSSSEENFSHFVIERSTDGKTFSDAAIIFSNGAVSQQTNYRYKDYGFTSVNGIIYYRLRMVGMDHEISYSQIRVVQLIKEDETLKLLTFPNPVSDQLRITLPDNWQGKTVLIEIYTASGVRMQNHLVLKTSQTELLNLTNLSKGIYIIKATCNNELAQQKVIKN